LKYKDIKIITAASEGYSESLFAMIGSINANWDKHPPIVVYDIGLSDKSLAVLKKSDIVVKKVIPFCDHWRDHYTWKLWCLNDIDAEYIIWMDAGLCVLDDLNEIINEVNLYGYFIVPNYQFLDWEASEKACNGCGLDFSFRIGKPSISANIFGIKKNGIFMNIIKTALELGQNLEIIKAYNSQNRHDQAILSLLFHKNIPNLKFNDGKIYSGWISPNMVLGQKVWAHRRSMKQKDLKVFINIFKNKSSGKYFPNQRSYYVINKFIGLKYFVCKIIRW
jgi:hypothetical protein